MRKLPNGLLSLQISDDGIGMPTVSASREQSLGLTLMKSIGQKLAGSFTIHSSTKGVLVAVEFAPAPIYADAVSSLS